MAWLIALAWLGTVIAAYGLGRRDEKIAVKEREAFARLDHLIAAQKGVIRR